MCRSEDARCGSHPTTCCGSRVKMWRTAGTVGWGTAGEVKGDKCWAGCPILAARRRSRAASPRSTGSGHGGC